MAKLPRDTTETINLLKQQAINILDAAGRVELTLFEQQGENDETLSFLEELKTVAEDATSAFSQLSILQLNIARTQFTADPDMLKLLIQAIGRTEARIPAWERSVEEVKIEWKIL